MGVVTLELCRKATLVCEFFYNLLSCALRGPKSDLATGLSFCELHVILEQVAPE